MTIAHRAIAATLLTVMAAHTAGIAVAQTYQGSDVPPEALQEYVSSVEEQGPHRPSPRLVGAAMLINLVYIPARLILTATVGVFGGLAGFLTFGDQAAADSIFSLASGPQVITPEMLEGTERWHLGAYD
jgi:hypothetical protein